MKGRKTGFREFVFLVATLMGSVALAINMLLPAFQDIATDFQLADKNQVQLSISLLYLGLGASQLLYGSLSDSIGRKQTVYIGLGLFVLGCIVSMNSYNLFILLVGQVIQGTGLGAARVMSVAMMRDKFEGNEMARALSFIMLLYIFMPTFSPILGKLIINFSNWRTLFGVYIIYGCIIFLLFRYRMNETLLQEKQKKLNSQYILKAVFKVVENKKSMGFIIILGLYSSVFIAYLNLSQSIFEFQYHLKDKYPYYFATLALTIGLASFVNAKLVLQYGMNRLVSWAINGNILITILFLVIHYAHPPSFEMFFLFMFVQLFGYGILIGNLTALAMEPLGAIAGTAASIIGAISILISVPLSIFIGSFYVNSVSPIVLGFLLVGVLSWLILSCIYKI